MRGNNKKILGWKLVLSIISIIILSIVIWSLFFRYAECTNWDCFNQHLANCNRAKFIGGTNMIFGYTIIGNSKNGCEVNVKLLQGNLDNSDSKKLENQEMICTLPKGVIMLPESNIGNCHGLLKEGLQDLIIKKLHTYLIKNLGIINLGQITGSS